jgi:hypothetical protein
MRKALIFPTLPALLACESGPKRYYPATVYCPNTPPLVLDSVSSWRRYENEILISTVDGHEWESVTCSVRWGTPHMTK